MGHLTRQLIERIRTLGRHVRPRERTVAIACQGGGSHAAFTAGVLGQLLEEWPARYRLVGFSGTSGGAVSATAAWYGLVAEGRTPAAVLRDVWDDVAASTGWERWINQLALLKAEFPGSSLSGGSPYSNPASGWGRKQLETILSDRIDFGAFGTLTADDSTPALFVSAVDVLTGDPVVFRDDDVTAEAVIASAAVPHLFEAVELDNAYHWDGVFAQNPPILEFKLDDSIPSVDELWVIRLSPKTVATCPTTGDEISTRTQQIVENLSLTHELRFVETMNEWLDAGTLSTAAFTNTTVRTIDLQWERTETSRLARRSSFISDLYADGEAEATNFLHELPDGSDA